MKNDYDQKIADAQADLDNFKQVSLDTQESSERRLEDMMINKINEISSNLMEQMSKIYHSSIQSETNLMKKIEDMEQNMKNLNENFDNMTVQLEDVQEKMYDFEQNKKNNLIFYGIPGDMKESKDDLKHKIFNLLKLRLNIRREIPILRASRMLTGNSKCTYILILYIFLIKKFFDPGPRVHNCRPALVTFETFRDREDVLKNSKALGRSQVSDRYKTVMEVISVNQKF